MEKAFSGVRRSAQGMGYGLNYWTTSVIERRRGGRFLRCSPTQGPSRFVGAMAPFLTVAIATNQVMGLLRSTAVPFVLASRLG